MFKLTRPCSNCPFRKGVGEKFCLPRLRLREIFRGTAFQCHKTVNYEDWDDEEKRSGDHPQQCAGLMSLLYREGRPNTIMQVGERMGHFDPEKLDHADVYESIEAAVAAHCGSEEDDRTKAWVRRQRRDGPSLPRQDGQASEDRDVEGEA